MRFVSDEALELLDAMISVGAVFKADAVAPKALRAALDISDRGAFDAQMAELLKNGLIVRVHPEAIDESVRYYVSVKRVSDYAGVDEEDVFEQAGKAPVPAAGRIVTVDHNLPEVVQAISDVKRLAADLREKNDLGNLTPEQANVAADEVDEIGASLSKPTIRLSAIRERAISTLQWVGKEAAGSLVGAAALALLAVLASIFGFAI